MTHDLFNQEPADKGAYYNTTNVDATTKKEYDAITGKQNQAIYNFFVKNPEQEISASIVEFNQVLAENTPLTSVRRSLHTLHTRGLIVRIGEREGQFGRKEFTYKLK